VSIILGFLTLLGGLVGYIGFTSFNALKKDYTKEIDDLRALKITIEEEFRNILSQQQQVRIDVDKISKLNEEQERRLKILEITEKAGQYVANRNFSWALEYISNGLMLDPKDLRLLQMKSTCHGKLGEFASAIDALKRALEIDPESAPNINNLAEYFLLANQIEAFDAYRDAHKKVIEETYDGALLAYLLALRGFMRGSVPEIVAPVREYIQKASPGAKQHMGPWEFDESILLINGSNNAQAKAAMLEAINYFGGARPGESTFAYQPAEGPVAH